MGWSGLFVYGRIGHREMSQMPEWYSVVSNHTSAFIIKVGRNVFFNVLWSFMGGILSLFHYACMLSHFSHVQLFATLWIVACQAPLSMGFSRQEYWSGLPFPSPGNLPNPGIEHASLMSPALAGVFFTTATTSEALFHDGELNCRFLSFFFFLLILKDVFVPQAFLLSKIHNMSLMSLWNFRIYIYI